VGAAWRGIRRTIGTAQAGKTTLLTADIRAMVVTLPGTPHGLRDRALILLGFAGAFRHSELVALDVGDIEVTHEGAIVTVRRSKTDQEGAGQQVGIPRGRRPATCPVTTLAAWLEQLDAMRIEGLHGRAAPQAAAAADLDPTRYAGHSLSAGLATSAAIAGVEERAIMAQTRHRSVTVARRYIRDGSLFRGNAAAAVGLCGD
jgi:integrase